MKITQAILTQLYVEQNKSGQEIAKQLGVSNPTVYKKLKEYNIPKRHSKYKNIIGQQFGKWTVVEQSSPRKCKAKCSCGRVRELQVSSLVHGGSKTCYWCRNNLRSGAKNPHWQGYKEISGSWWKFNIKKAAERRKIPFKISIEYAWELFEKQERKCALTGMSLSFAKECKKRCETTASLDRIDSMKGYTKNNIQWVHRTVNMMKMALPQDEFIRFCKAVTDHHQQKTR